MTFNYANGTKHLAGQIEEDTVNGMVSETSECEHNTSCKGWLLSQVVEQFFSFVLRWNRR